ncbi:sterile alpha motif domain-containing protein 9-like isoform X2 [Puntigrus tetrazona]|uniref:sterile alpha motif domain-containing protein 9-like isoform X2 n=1 Tax=Puntigrus tetrazona TaxID=1606681 RepID=UPI001C897FFA|nr:sterile alpha motif domain-containing protein 9-like isoform X2 [Puntigrus tetrazona]
MEKHHKRFHFRCKISFLALPLDLLKWSCLHKSALKKTRGIAMWNTTGHQVAKILYNNEVYGASLIHFDKQDLLDIGLSQGPAVHITKIVAKLKTSYHATTKDADALIGTSAAHQFQQETGRAESHTSWSDKQLDQISIEENSDTSSVEIWSRASEDVPRCTGNASHFQDENAVRLEEQYSSMYAKADEASSAQPLMQCAAQTNIVESETKEQVTGEKFRYCAPRPFDKSSETFEYTQNDILPIETGPSNLIDPIHEYKLLANTQDALEENVLKKFKNEAFWFCAACINSRSNGTIHFGVGDEPLHKHGQIIGLEVPRRDKYVDAFDKGLKEHFREKSVLAMACIRPPKFVKVNCPNNEERWVIEIDVVPKYKLTQKKRFHTTLNKKENKTKCLFVRSGASTINCLPENYSKISDKKLSKLNKNLNKDIELWALKRQLAEEDIAILRK